jgi:hypothetical protein
VQALVQTGGTVAQRLILGFSAHHLRRDLLLLELRQRLLQLQLALIRQGLLDPHTEHVPRCPAIGPWHGRAGDAEFALDPVALEPMFALRGTRMRQRGVLGCADRCSLGGRHQVGVDSADHVGGAAP